MSDKEITQFSTVSKDKTIIIEIMGRGLNIKDIAVTLGFIFLLTAPISLGSYYTSVLGRALALSIFALSLDILWGYGGILTFGHAAIFGLGAYTMAKILAAGVTGAGYIGLIAGALIPGVIGLLFAGMLFYRRLDQNTFVIITLALAVIGRQVVISWQSVTGGYNGLIGIPEFQVGLPSVAMVPLGNFALYYLLIAIVYATYRFSKRLINSPFGTVLIAIRENEQKARSLGYNLEKYKTLVFGLASAMAGFAGALHTIQTNFVAPNLVGFVLSTQVIVWVLIGGRGTLIGAIVGTVFLVLFESVVSGVFEFGWTLLVGIILLLIVLAFPGGLMQMFGGIRERLAAQWES